MKFIILTSGLPSSGKTSYCFKLHCETGIRIVSYDSYLDSNKKKMVGDPEFLSHVSKELDKSGHAIVEWIATTRQRRTGFLKALSQRHSFHTICLYFPVTLEQAIARRSRRDPARLKKLTDLFNRFEPPMPSEGMELIQIANSRGGIRSDFVEYLHQLAATQKHVVSMSNKNRHFGKSLAIED